MTVSRKTARNTVLLEEGYDYVRASTSGMREFEEERGRGFVDA